MRRQRMLGFPVLIAIALVIVQHSSAARVPDAQPASAAPSLSGPAQPMPAGEVLERMDGARTTVRRMLEEARAQRDVIKTLCLDDKLNQIDVTLRSARDRKSSIDGAAQKNDLELAARETVLLDVLRQRTDQLSAEANLCISNPAETVGPSAIVADIDPNIADEPAYYPPGIIIIEPPPTGSVIK